MTIQLAFICGVCIIFISGINGWLSIIDMYGHWYKHKNINDMVVHQSSLLRSLLLILVRNKIDTTYFEQDACSGVHTGLIMRVLVCNSRTVWITLTCTGFFSGFSLGSVFAEKIEFSWTAGVAAPPPPTGVLTPVLNKCSWDGMC
jgi:hypothetical protein